MFNGHENFEKIKDVVSMGVPWTMARSILYLEVLGTYLCFAGVMPFQNIHPVRSFIASTIVQCANFFPEYSIVGSCTRADPVGGNMGDASPPPTIFKHVFDEYNFSIISNLFDNNKPYALSTHNGKCTNKMHHIWCNTQN